MSDDYSSSDGGSCDSGSSSHSDCSYSSSDPAPCSHSSNVDNQLANDLLMYGMATQLFSADDSGTIRRERVAPEDFVIMRKDAEQRTRAYAESSALPCQETRWSPWWKLTLFGCACIIATVALIKWWFP